MGLGGLFLLLGFVPIALYMVLFAFRINIFTDLWGILASFIGLIIVSAVASYAISPIRLKKTGRRVAFGITATVFFGILALAMQFIFFQPNLDPLFLRFMVIIPMFISVVLATLIVAFNEKFKEFVGRARGFKKNIRLVEKQRINMLVKENPSYFYDILPYAYILGITEEYSKQFESLNIPSPSWYVSTSNANLFNIIIFTSLMNRSFNNLSNRAIANTVRSSGGSSGFGGGGIGGGGGFGGGGFGGGGIGRA